MQTFQSHSTRRSETTRVDSRTGSRKEKAEVNGGSLFTDEARKTLVEALEAKFPTQDSVDPYHTNTRIVSLLTGKMTKPSAKVEFLFSILDRFEGDRIVTLSASIPEQGRNYFNVGFNLESGSIALLDARDEKGRSLRYRSTCEFPAELPTKKPLDAFNVIDGFLKELCLNYSIPISPNSELPANSQGR